MLADQHRWRPAALQVRSGHGARATAPRCAERPRRRVPLPGGPRDAHAHRRGRDLRRPAAAVRTSSSSTSARVWTASRATARSSPSRRSASARPRWIDDPSFNLEYHVRHAALPAPGDDAQLRRLIARIYSQRLDRAKPLWELLARRGPAATTASRSSPRPTTRVVDGVSGVDITTALFDVDPAGAR